MGFLAHLLIICASYIISFYVRFDFAIPSRYLPIILKTIPALILIKVVTFYYFHLFSGLWKYVSMDDLWQILKANVISTVAFILAIVFIFGLKGFPRSIFILDWFICVGLVSGIRFLSRSFRERFVPRHSHKKVKALIIGAGEAGILVLKELKKNISFEVVGFIDDDLSKKGMQIHSKKILGGKKDIKNVSEKYGIEEIIIAMPSQKGAAIRDIISYCQLPDVKIQIVPGLYEILSGDVVTKLRDVRPEDLLGRETVDVDEGAIREHVFGKTILVTGAAGSIGSEISRQISKLAPKTLILVDWNENDLYFLERELKDKGPDFEIIVSPADIKEVSVLKYIFQKFSPQIIFHAAAFKHVPMMEGNPASAVKNNIICSRNLIYAANHYGVESFVLISSDKAVNPTNVMGATKRITEMIMQAKAKTSKTKFIAVRFGNVLGSKGSVVPLFKKQIEDAGRVTVTHPEARRFFMSTIEAVQLVLQASAIGKGGEIFVLDMGEQIKILEFAKNLITLSGLRPDEDVKIDFIGLRPGEKLYEEALHDAEKDQATKHEKIFIAQPDNFDNNKLMKQIKELERLSDLMDSDKIVEKIKEIVPSYSSNRSKEG